MLVKKGISEEKVNDYVEKDDVPAQEKILENAEGPFWSYSYFVYWCWSSYYVVHELVWESDVLSIWRLSLGLSTKLCSLKGGSHSWHGSHEGAFVWLLDLRWFKMESWTFETRVNQFSGFICKFTRPAKLTFDGYKLVMSIKMHGTSDNQCMSLYIFISTFIVTKNISTYS